MGRGTGDLSHDYNGTRVWTRSLVSGEPCQNVAGTQTAFVFPGSSCRGPLARKPGGLIYFQAGAGPWNLSGFIWIGIAGVAHEYIQHEEEEVTKRHLRSGAGSPHCSSSP
ncbi:hypothetical protein SKAU_G00302130 [Synaphobranchus kaupii]|uniref:Uncharacterized protein n=1 Tax=Synaphobranchus kaupii TaxID=118154 RepID=A0A9Q1EVV6_SYNKA|nr:hypothetical protein SKAU_G00302130 [Synaphobranchus kaupii]